jgi:carbonic anhydrase/acetyltransferase-like protein (isoleucine patch superfamily)
MTLHALDGEQPDIAGDVWIAPSADVIGRIRLHRAVSVWFGAVLRGDNEWIEIGAESNIQDGAVLHTDMGAPLVLGGRCSVGHRAILHGCTIGEGSLVGMGATILNHAVIGRHCLVGANALVTEGKVFPDRSLIVGAPARVVKTLDDAAVERCLAVGARYVVNGRRFAAGLRPLNHG